MPRLWTLLIIAALSACASTPDVAYSYYPVKATGLVSVTQTVDCNSSGTDLVVLYSPAVTTSYAADYAQNPYTLTISDLDSPFADTDFGFNLYDDGRLKGINATTTGQAEATAKAAVSLATAAQALGGGAPQARATPAPLPACAIIAELGKGRPVSITYEAPIDYANFTPNVPVNLDPAPASRPAYEALKSGLPLLQVLMNTPVPNRSGARYAKGAGRSGFIPLTLQEIDNAQIDILAQGQPIFSGAVTIPSNRAYELPIPKAVLFGKQGFSLSLSEAGVITSIDYNKGSGAAGGLNVVSGAATEAAPASVTVRAADTQAQADLIAQQQRLARCQADPSQCK